MKNFMKILYTPILFLVLVSCSGPRLIEGKGGYLLPSSEIRQTNEIRYKFTTSLDERNVLTFRLQNLSDFTWYVAREAFYPSHMTYDFFINGFWGELLCVRDIADIFGATEKVEVNGTYERKFELEEHCESIPSLKTGNYITFYWHDKVDIYDSPKFSRDEQGNVIIGRQRKQLGSLKFMGKVKLQE